MSPLAAEARAKVNLALAVTARRDDGYHLLRSVFVRLALHDTLEVAPAGGAPSDSLTVEGALEASEDNLILRASRQLRASLGADLPALRFYLRKRIPVAAGLGGGSADAAAAIDLALRAWGVSLPVAERQAAALRLGADVPFFASGAAAALVEGIGEQLTHLPAPHPPAGVLLVTPPPRLSTADVFAAYDRHPAATDSVSSSVDELVRALGAGIDGATVAALASSLHEANDLWPAARSMAPSLAATREVAGRILARPLALTGSGPTLVAVYPSPEEAAHAAVRLEAAAAPELVGASIIATATSARGVEP